jgi:hypothetical protein
MAQVLAQILPDHLVELVGRSVARGALLFRIILGPVELARAHVVSVLSVVVFPAGSRPRYGTQHAGTAAHQRPEKVLVGLVVVLGEGLVLGELLFCEVELLLAHHRRHLCNEDPLLLGQRDGGVVGVSYGVGGRASDLWGTVAHAPGVDLARESRGWSVSRAGWRCSTPSRPWASVHPSP